MNCSEFTQINKFYFNRYFYLKKKAVFFILESRTDTGFSRYDPYYLITLSVNESSYIGIHILVIMTASVA